MMQLSQYSDSLRPTEATMETAFEEVTEEQRSELRTDFSEIFGCEEYTNSDPDPTPKNILW